MFSIHIEFFIDLQKGSLLVLSPYWAHRDATYFPEPELFKPERWEGMSVRGLTWRQGFLAHGGGRNMCPGRWVGALALPLQPISAVMYLRKMVLLFLSPLTTLGWAGVL